MAKVIIDARGNKNYYDGDYRRNRTDGPAYINRDGGKGWYRDGAWVSGASRDGIYAYSVESGDYRSSNVNGHKFIQIIGHVQWPELK